MAPEMMPGPDGNGMVLARAKENFAELTLAGSELKPEQPLLGSREHTPAFDRELWRLQWRPNDPIDIWIMKPHGVKNPPVVLYLYGYPTDTDRFRDISYCQRITHGGAAAVGFVSALTGYRGEHGPMKDTLISKMDEALPTTVHDISLILDFLATRGDLDMTRVGIFGQGSGGAIAILSASIEPRIKTLDLLDPWGDWPHWFAQAADVNPKDRTGFLTPEFQKPLEKLEPLHYLPLLKQKIRIQYVADEGEPASVIDAMKAAAPKDAEFKRYDTSSRMYSENAGGRLFEWMAHALGAQPLPPPQTAEAPAQPNPAQSSNP